MRRILVAGVAMVVFTLPWAVGDRSTPEPAAVAAGTTPVSPAADSPLEQPEPESGSLDRATITAAMSIPSIGADTHELPAGIDYWTFANTGIPDDFATRSREIDGVTAAFAYPAGTIHLVASHRADGTVVAETTPGWFIPLDAAIVSPKDLVTYLGVDLGLGPEHVVLGEGSAALRGLAIGDTMTFESGATLTVGAVVPDMIFGEPEIIALSLAPFDEERFEARAAMVRFTGDESTLRDELETIFGEEQPFGLLHRHEHADSGPRIVRSWVFMKQTFGEFEYRPANGVAVEIEPAWLDEHIVEVDIPLLGRTKCHVRFAETLTGVMNQLIAEGNEDIITKRTFFGCWNPRYIRGTTRLSRHSFGIAADINFSSRTGDITGSPVHSALLDAMDALGVHSGHVWVTPDPGHFEYYGFPATRPSDDRLR